MLSSPPRERARGRRQQQGKENNLDGHEPARSDQQIEDQRPELDDKKKGPGDTTSPQEEDKRDQVEHSTFVTYAAARKRGRRRVVICRGKGRRPTPA